MSIKKIELENFTVFENMEVSFCKGINVMLGENGIGKTHIMKVLYAACQSSRHDVSFSQKTVMVFRPDGFSIGRLISRKKGEGHTARVTVISDMSKIGMSFTNKTKKWDAKLVGEEQWERQMSDLTSVFIPAKEILSNAWNLESAVKMGNVELSRLVSSGDTSNNQSGCDPVCVGKLEFDDTYLDIIAAAKVDISKGVDSAERKKYLDLLQKISMGKVTISDERFYLKSNTQAKLEFNLVAEGLRKIALAWQLIKNGTLEKGAVLFWDEPGANVNPKYIPVLVELLLMLQKEGVQIFISTHDYFLSKYIDVKRTAEDSVRYCSFYNEDEKGNVSCEIAESFDLLEHNAIMETFRQLYMDEIGVSI